MDGYIKYTDLVFGVLFILGSFLLVYLILILSNIHSILKDVKKTVKKNIKNIDDTLEQVPEISKNAAQITKVVKEEAETIQTVIDNVGKISDNAKDATDIIKKDIVLKVKSIIDIIDIIKQKFSSDKPQKKAPKKKNKKEVVYSYKYGEDKKPEKVVITETDDKDLEEDNLEENNLEKEKMEKDSEENEE